MEKIEKKKAVAEIEKAINSKLEIVTNDKEFESYFKDIKWDDLNILHEEIGSKIFEFINNVSSLLLRKDIIDNLEDQRENFERLIELFFTDINNFSFKVKEVYEQHKDKKGHITNFNDFDLYNRLAVQYNFLTTELLSITAPTLTEIILITKEKIDNKILKNQHDVTGENKNGTEQSTE